MSDYIHRRYRRRFIPDSAPPEPPQICATCHRVQRHEPWAFGCPRWTPVSASTVVESDYEPRNWTEFDDELARFE